MFNPEFKTTNDRRRLWRKSSWPRCLRFPFAVRAADLIPAPGTKLAPATNDIVITAADVTVEKVGNQHSGLRHRRAGGRGDVVAAALG